MSILALYLFYQTNINLKIVTQRYENKIINGSNGCIDDYRIALCATFIWFRC